MKTLRQFTRNRFFSHARIMAAVILISAAAAMLLLAASPPASAQPTARAHPLTPKFSAAVAFDVSPALRDLVPSPKRFAPSSTVLEVRPERGPRTRSKGYSGDAALQALSPAVAIPSPFDKNGNKLLGPVDTGTLWAGFAVPDCTEPSGDPVVLYDQLEDRWILTQFTTSGFSDPTRPFFNCVAVSTTGDPTGTYFRYAFETKNFQFFPDYPKYGLWRNSYILTTREFGPTTEYGIGVYALERDKMLLGDPNARAVSFFLDSAVVPISQIGDGLLPPDIDGKTKPANGAPAPIVGTQDDGGPYGATFDALNIWELDVKWLANPVASLVLKTQLAVGSFDSIFPCGGNPGQTSRDCLPNPAWRQQPITSSTSCPTASGRPSASPTATLARTNRW